MLINILDVVIFLILYVFVYPLTKYNVILTIFVAFMSLLIIKSKPKEN